MDRVAHDGGGRELPTEAQWEYAYRAGSGGDYSGSGLLDDLGWYQDNSDARTHRGGLKQPNRFGLHDMHGNVWEWCEDYYDDYPYHPVEEPAGPREGERHALRGGAWNSRSLWLRAAFRHEGIVPGPRGPSHGNGLRPVRARGVPGR